MSEEARVCVFTGHRVVPQSEKRRLQRALLGAVEELYLAGYSGTADCDARRKRLMQRLHLPEKLGANAFLEALNLMMTREEFLQYGENND